MPMGDINDKGHGIDDARTAAITGAGNPAPEPEGEDHE